jgi:hypothetical protein
VALSVRSIILEQALDVVERELRAERFAEAAMQFLEDAAGPVGASRGMLSAKHSFQPAICSPRTRHLGRRNTQGTPLA